MADMDGVMALGPCGAAIPREAWGTVADAVPVEVRLVGDAARGDRGAFARLVDLHQRTVFGLCVRLLADREEARDAAQETFVRAWGGIGTFDPANPFAPWLLRIARNHCIDVLRRRLPAARRLELDAGSAGDGGRALDLPDTASPAADEQLVGAQQASAVAGAVAALPPNYREVVHLFHVEHMSYKDIAATMEVPIGTIMTWLHRARAKLRERMREQEEQS